MGRMASPHGLVLDRGVVLDRGNPPGSAGDTSLDAAASTLRAERVATGGVLDAWCVLHLSPRAAPIKAQRVGSIVPLSHP